MGSSPISRVTPQSKVMPFEGLLTIEISFFQPATVPMICCEPRLTGAGGSVGCRGRRTLAFLAVGATAFRKEVMLGHISCRVWAPSFARGGRALNFIPFSSVLVWYCCPAVFCLS